MADRYPRGYMVFDVTMTYSAKIMAKDDDEAKETLRLWIRHSHKDYDLLSPGIVHFPDQKAEAQYAGFVYAMNEPKAQLTDEGAKRQLKVPTVEYFHECDHCRIMGEGVTRISDLPPGWTRLYLKGEAFSFCCEKHQKIWKSEQ